MAAFTKPCDGPRKVCTNLRKHLIKPLFRMGLAYSEAAVSITVTSLTDFLSFFAGVITPFPCVRIFCIYTATAVAFIYIWQLTFFGACLVSRS